MAKFYRCKECGNIVGLVNEGGGTLTCCGSAMEELIPNTQEGVATEKHIPLVHEENGKVYVQVGAVLHPMVEDHYIEWVYLLTDQGAQRKILKPGMEPKVVFQIAENEVVLEVLAYCNKHGLWAAKLD
ncbi:MAG: Desulfoferrodoxin [Tenericutes bacterium ADurb.BinA155]|nr:MAG: Desulfoferrodoxin [Tenericutes bacterium ADurb.BinA155]